MKNKRRIKKNLGITLIALVVTIVVLLILAGVSINLVMENNGITNKAKDAQIYTRAGSVEDEVGLWRGSNYLAKNTDGTTVSSDIMLQELKDKKLIYENEIDRKNEVIIIKKKDGTVVKEIPYGEDTIYTYTEDGYITGIKENFLTNEPETTSNMKQNIKLANLNSDSGIKLAAMQDIYLKKELNGCITIPKEIEGTKIVGISPGAFFGIFNLKKVIIDADITEIGKGAFGYCMILESINLPDSVQTIGTQIFEYCDSLTTITIPEGVTTIEGGAFSNCNINEITIPESVVNMGESVFEGDKQITVNVPFKEEEQPSTWNANWDVVTWERNYVTGSRTPKEYVKINYKK